MATASGIAKKIKRFGDGQRLRVLDLFSGCGGFSLGFHGAGFSIIGAIEIDPQAIASHSINFSASNLQRKEAEVLPLDITKVSPVDYFRTQGTKTDVNQVVDVLIGGPPCQAFARIGRAKLREITNDPRAHQSDERANLVADYIRFVDELRPLALVIENVPDMMNQGGVNIVANVCESLSRLGYVCRYTLLNSAYYGVPQFRERVFVIGFHESLGLVPKFPTPTHWLDLPAGYMGTRRVAMKPIIDSGKSCQWFEDVVMPCANLEPAVSCEEALGDLPKILEHLSGGMPKGARRLDNAVRYSRNRKPSKYAKEMRDWPGFSTTDAVNSHVVRSLPRDYDTFRQMRPGDQYPEAYQVAVQRFKKELARHISERRIVASTEGGDLWKSIVPPYDPEKFPNKWWKMVADQPSRTLTAHIGKDTYSHIHYDSSQARTISVREAARLQSFPDGFQFAGAMNAAFRQIGNAVPPLLARAIANTIRRQLKKAVQLKKVKE
jgi:DNA (cytosine-5)-methyltransferase 1